MENVTTIRQLTISDMAFSMAVCVFVCGVARGIDGGHELK